MSDTVVVPINYFDSVWGGLATTNLLLAVCSVVTATAVGWNRLSGVAVAVSIFSFIANTCGWDGFNSAPLEEIAITGRSTRTAGYVFWSAQEIGSTFYSYFLLTVILNSTRELLFGVSRYAIFLGVYWFLTLLYCAIRFSMIGVFTQTWVVTDETKNGFMWKITDLLNLMACVVLATIELTTASLLILDFHKALKISQMHCSGRQMGLYKRLILSTELRVASLAAIGITRAAVMIPKRTSSAWRGVDMVAVIAQNIYPALLNLDQLIAKMLYITDRPGIAHRQNPQLQDGSPLDGAQSPQRHYQAVEAVTMGGSFVNAPGLRNRGGRNQYDDADLFESGEKSNVGSTGIGRVEEEPEPAAEAERKDSEINSEKLTLAKTNSNSIPKGNVPNHTV